MAKAKDAPEVEEEEVVGAEEETVEKEPVVTSGVSISLMGDTSFAALSASLDPEERKVAIRNTLEKSAKIEDRLKLVQGELLYEVNENGYWRDWTFVDEDGEERPFMNIDEYFQAEVGMSRRTAFYIISIYRTFVVELALDEELLKNLEWSKAKEVVSVISKDNAEEVFDKISKMSVSQVKKWVKEEKGAAAGGKSGAAGASTGGTTVTKSFKLAPEQAETIEKALEIAGKITGSDKPAANLDAICTEYISSSMAAGAVDVVVELEKVLDAVQRTFGVTLEVTDFGTLAERENLSEEDDD
jgi:hypothetical protein